MMNPSQERLAIFLPGLYEGGAERVMLNLAREISARGHPVDLVLARAEGPYMDQVPESVRLVDLKASRVAASTPALVRYLRREQPAALLSAMFANLIALWAKRLCGLPRRLVITEHNTLVSVVRNKQDLRWQAYPRLAGWFYPWADAIVAVSEGVANDLVQAAGLPRGSIQVVYNPIITDELKRKAAARLEHPWFEVGQPPVILGIGRLTEQKAFDLLLHAFSRVHASRPVRLVVLGEGEDRPVLESLAMRLGVEQDVSWMGFVQNPYPYLASTALFVLPSRWEGLPTVLVEALYTGTPIVATDCPGGSKEILKNGRYGKLVPVDSLDLLARAMENTLDDGGAHPPRESWEPFQSDLVTERYMDLLFGA